MRHYTIGSNPDNNIVVQSQFVSRYHGDLYINDDDSCSQYTFVDHSTNGTSINGMLLHNSSCFITPDDTIYLAGQMQLVWNHLIHADNGNGTGQLPFSKPTISFAGALKSFFQKYVDFSGRARRKEYWFAMLWLLIFSVALSLIGIIACGGYIFSAWDSLDFEDLLYAMGGMGIIMLIFRLAIFLPSLSILVRRIHDTGRDGLWILMLLVPLANLVFFFIWTLSPSEPRINKWGKQ